MLLESDIVLIESAHDGDVRVPGVGGVGLRLVARRQQRQRQQRSLQKRNHEAVAQPLQLSTAGVAETRHLAAPQIGGRRRRCHRRHRHCHWRRPPAPAARRLMQRLLCHPANNCWTRNALGNSKRWDHQTVCTAAGPRECRPTTDRLVAPPARRPRARTGASCLTLFSLKFPLQIMQNCMVCSLVECLDVLRRPKLTCIGYFCAFVCPATKQSSNAFSETQARHQKQNTCFNMIITEILRLRLLVW